MTKKPFAAMTTDKVFKLAVLIILGYMAYLLSGYASNGRYEMTSFQNNILIVTDTRTGESLLTVGGVDELMDQYLLDSDERSILYDHQAKLQETRFKNSEATQEKSGE